MVLNEINDSITIKLKLMTDELMQARDENANYDWLHDPPFRWKDTAIITDGKYALECYCKRVKFIVMANPLDVKICHCDTCKALHGAPMQTAAIFNKTDVCLTEGREGDISFLRSADAEPRLTTHLTDCPRKIYCTTCGSPLADEGRKMLMIFPSSLRPLQSDIQVHKRVDTEQGRHTAGVLYKLPNEFRIRKHIFYSQRAFDIPDGVEKWEGLDKKSSQLRDDGTIIVDKPQIDIDK